MSKINFKLGRELGSFYALVVMNIVAGAVAMGLSVSYGIQSVLAFVQALPGLELLYSLPVVAMALAAFGVAISWLVSSAEIFGEAQEIRDEFEEGEAGDDASTTSIIVKTMALYRERKTQIQRMAWVSRLVGVLLLGIGAYNLASIALFGVWGEPIIVGVSVAMNLAIGAGAIYIPHLFSNFSRSWDTRVAQGERASEELRRVLEGGA